MYILYWCSFCLCVHLMFSHHTAESWFHGTSSGWPCGGYGTRAFVDSAALRRDDFTDQRRVIRVCDRKATEHWGSSKLGTEMHGAWWCDIVKSCDVTWWQVWISVARALDPDYLEEQKPGLSLRQQAGAAVHVLRHVAHVTRAAQRDMSFLRRSFWCKQLWRRLVLSRVMIGHDLWLIRARMVRRRSFISRKRGKTSKFIKFIQVPVFWCEEIHFIESFSKQRSPSRALVAPPSDAMGPGTEVA